MGHPKNPNHNLFIPRNYKATLDISNNRRCPRYRNQTTFIINQSNIFFTIVFNDKASLRKLEEIIHSYVWQETDKFLSKCQQSGERAAVLDIPLLIECGWHQKVDEVWLVVLPVEEQIMRTMKRSGMTAEAVQARIAAQMPLDQKKKYATLVIDNSGAWEETEKQVITAWEKAVK